MATGVPPIAVNILGRQLTARGAFGAGGLAVGVLPTGTTTVLLASGSRTAHGLPPGLTFAMLYNLISAIMQVVMFQFSFGARPLTGAELTEISAIQQRLDEDKLQGQDPLTLIQNATTVISSAHNPADSDIVYLRAARDAVIQSYQS